MPFPEPAKDFITFTWPNDFTIAQIDQIRRAVAACKSAGLQAPPWSNVTRAFVISTKCDTSAQGDKVVDVNYWGRTSDGKETAMPVMQTVTLTGF